MRKSLQNLAEQKTYDILFELENEFEIDTNKLPEVYFVSNNFDFKKLGLNTERYEDFYLTKLTKEPFFIPDKNIIAIANFNQGQIAEETGHFIHYNYLKKQDNFVDEFCADAISEMIGFFSSKFIDPKRKTFFRGDQFMGKRTLNRIIETIKYVNMIGEIDNLTHQQGYALGEKLYYKYMSNDISKKKVKDMIKKPLDKKGDAFYEFLNLKYEILK